MPRLIRAAIGTVADVPVKYVVYSHSSADHSTGGGVFADTAEFVGQRLTGARMAAHNDPASPPPTLTFDSRLTLELGPRRIELYAADLWEQDDYIIVHDPAARIVMFVDVVQPSNVPFRRLVGEPDRARRAGAADHSPEMLASVRAALGPSYGAWRRFDEMVDLNVEGMLRWRAGEHIGHYLGAPE